MENIYKQAAELGLRFTGVKGLISADKLFSLNTAILADMIKDVVVKINELQPVTGNPQLSFLSNAIKTDTREVRILNLQYEILKDVFLTLTNREKEAQLKAASAKDAKELANTANEILLRRKLQNMENLSDEELLKLATRR